MSLPNIIIVLVDDMGWSDVGYHDPSFNSPNIDRLASEGVKIESFYVSPSCTPSRSQLMTGRYNHRTGMQDSVVHSTEPRGVPLNETFLSSKLKDKGYVTGAIGKWHLGMHMPQYVPLNRGFDRHYGILTGGGDHVRHESVSQVFSARYTDSSREFVGKNLWEDGNVSDDNFVAMHSTDLYSKKAVDYVHEFTQTGQPWFLYLAFQAVHDPIDTSPEWYESGKCADISEPERSFNENIDWNNRKIMCGMVSHIDHGIGQLREALENNGVWENTVIVFFSDNGGKLEHGSNNAPFYGEKGQYWEGGIRVPAFISGGLVQKELEKRNQSPYVFNDLAHVTDIHATLLHLAHHEPTDDDKPLDGHNLWDSLMSSKPSPRKDVIINLNSHFFAQSGAVRAGNFKLMKNPDPMESVIYNKVKKSIKERDAVISQSDLYYIAHQEHQKLQLQKPKNVLFDIVRNPYEREDGACAIAEECTNLYDNPDYLDIRTKLENFFTTESARMVPASFNWADDGPLADPLNFNGVWSPWRDTKGQPLAMYIGSNTTSQYQPEMASRPFADTKWNSLDSLDADLVMVVLIGLLSTCVVSIACIFVVTNTSKRSRMRRKYTEVAVD